VGATTLGIYCRKCSIDTYAIGGVGAAACCLSRNAFMALR
jgi:hypothetical protein